MMDVQSEIHWLFDETKRDRIFFFIIDFESIGRNYVSVLGPPIRIAKSPDPVALILPPPGK